MKHLKKYKIFESKLSIDEVMLSLNEILFDLTDDDFNLCYVDDYLPSDMNSIIQKSKIYNKYTFQILKKNRHGFIHNRFILNQEIVDIINRCCDFCINNGYKCLISLDRANGKYVFAIEDISEYLNEDIYFIGIKIIEKK